MEVRLTGRCGCFFDGGCALPADAQDGAADVGVEVVRGGGCLGAGGAPCWCKGEARAVAVSGTMHVFRFGRYAAGIDRVCGDRAIAVIFDIDVGIDFNVDDNF